MWTRCSKLLLLAGLLAATAGCLGPRRDDYRSTRELSIPSSSEQADQLWEAAKDTVRHYGFQLDRADRATGTITTMPLTSKQFFEFWRRDVQTREDFWEASLNPIRRRVEIQMDAGAEDDWRSLSIAVHKDRLSSPDRQFNSTGAAYQFFGEELPSTTGIERVTAAYDTWVELGRDSALEDHLLRAIIERAGIVEEVATHAPQVE